MTFMVNHHVVRLNISVHDSISVTMVKSKEDFIDVIANICIRERGIENLEVGIVDVLKNEAGSLALRVSHNVKEANDVWPTAEILEDLYLALNLLLLNRLEDLNDAPRLVDDIESLEHFAVFSSTNLSNNLVVILVTPVYNETFIVPVLSRPLYIHIWINASHSSSSSTSFRSSRRSRR